MKSLTPPEVSASSGGQVLKKSDHPKTSVCSLQK